MYLPVIKITCQIMSSLVIMTTTATIINTAYKENNAVIAKPETIYIGLGLGLG